MAPPAPPCWPVYRQYQLPGRRTPLSAVHHRPLGLPPVHRHYQLPGCPAPPSLPCLAVAARSGPAPGDVDPGHRPHLASLCHRTSPPVHAPTASCSHLPSACHPRCPQRPGARGPRPLSLPPLPHHPQARLPQAALPGGLRRRVCGARPQEGLPHDQHSGASGAGGVDGWVGDWQPAVRCVRLVEPGLAGPLREGALRFPEGTGSIAASAPPRRSWTRWTCSTPSAPASSPCASWPPTCCVPRSRSTPMTALRTLRRRCGEAMDGAQQGARRLCSRQAVAGWPTAASEPARRPHALPAAPLNLVHGRFSLQAVRCVPAASAGGNL